MVQEFLEALFGGYVPPGFIEIRLLEDGVKPPRLLDRRWWRDIPALVADMPRLNRVAEKQRAGVFFGVLPRRIHGKGTADTIAAGSVAWADLDFRDYAGGEDEARDRLAAIPIKPSCVVNSGRGLHAYWFLTEPEPPEVCCTLGKRLQAALGSDNVADAPRILRLPLTKHRKDPANPRDVVIETLDAAHRCNPSDFDDFLPEVEAVTAASPAPEVEIEQELPPVVAALLSRHKRLRSLFDGTGKPLLKPDGTRCDQSESGYDFSVCLSLIAKDITDPNILATALACRPGTKPRSMDYLARTVAKALEFSGAGGEDGPGGDPHQEIDFAPEMVRIFDSDPKVYEITVGGKTMSLATGQLILLPNFKARFTDAFGRIPLLPQGKGAQQRWERIVNDWLQGAERIEVPPEASTWESQEQEVTFAVGDLSLGDSARDLDRACYLPIEDVMVFKTKAVMRILRADYRSEIRSHHLCSMLRNLGYDTRVMKIEGRPVRVWVAPKGAPIESVDDGDTGLRT